jgi:two-component system cell cycle sensor histidine kinase/response regulator CckA
VDGETLRPLVLVVDDEPLLHVIAGRVLERCGFDLLNATDGLEAIEILALAQRAPTLVISDLRMPRMNGLEFNRWLAARYPAVPVLFVSGFMDELPPPPAGPAVQAYLAKPFTPEMLLAQVRALCGPEADLPS